MATKKTPAKTTQARKTASSPSEAPEPVLKPVEVQDVPQEAPVVSEPVESPTEPQETEVEKPADLEDGPEIDENGYPKGSMFYNAIILTPDEKVRYEGEVTNGGNVRLSRNIFRRIKHRRADTPTHTQVGRIGDEIPLEELKAK